MKFCHDLINSDYSKIKKKKKKREVCIPPLLWVVKREKTHRSKDLKAMGKKISSVIVFPFSNLMALKPSEKPTSTHFVTFEYLLIIVKSSGLVQRRKYYFLP